MTAPDLVRTKQRRPYVPPRPPMEYHVDTRLSEELSARLDVAADAAETTRPALVRAILSSVLPPAARP